MTRQTPRIYTASGGRSKRPIAVQYTSFPLFDHTCDGTRGKSQQNTERGQERLNYSLHLLLSYNSTHHATFREPQFIASFFLHSAYASKHIPASCSHCKHSDGVAQLEVGLQAATPWNPRLVWENAAGAVHPCLTYLWLTPPTQVLWHTPPNPGPLADSPSPRSSG